MTFIASFRCHGGIVMCADSQETVGDYKLIVEKLTPVDAGKYTIALGAAGLGDLADSLLDQVQDWVATWGIFPTQKLKDKLRHKIYAFHKNEVAVYPEDDPQNKRITAILCLKQRDSTEPAVLLEICGSTVKEAGSFSLIGWDNAILHRIVRRLYKRDLPISRGITLGLHLFALVNDVSAFVGGETRILVAHENGIWKENPQYIKESTNRIAVFTTALDQLLFACCDLATSGPDFLGSLEEFKVNALELRKEYLQSAVEILYPTAHVALTYDAPFAHFPPSSFFHIKADGSVSYGEENAELLESMKKEFAQVQDDIKKIQETRRRLIKEQARITQTIGAGSGPLASGKSEPEKP